VRKSALDFGVHTPTLGLLATTPPPDFEGGATYASAVTMRLQLVVASMYSDESQMTAESATLDPYDSDAVGQFRTKWRGSDLLHPRLWVINQRLDPSIRAAANAIPSCKAAGGL
jgi:hypothetical protein